MMLRKATETNQKLHHIDVTSFPEGCASYLHTPPALPISAAVFIIFGYHHY